MIQRENINSGVIDGIRLINGLSIHYHFHKNTNDQRLIVFSNSLGTDFRIWHDCVDRLKNDFNILLYDKRGHGLSCTGASPYQINDHVNDLIGLMDFLRLSNALIVGLSVGGLIAQGTYHTRPDLVKALFCFATLQQKLVLKKCGTAVLPKPRREVWTL